MRILFKNTQEEGVLTSIMKIVSVPLTIIRDYTVPIGEEDQWDRQRASITPVTLIFAFIYLNGDMEQNEESEYYSKPFLYGLISILPGALVGLMIKFCTKVSEGPPALITVFAMLCFIMSIMWI